MHIWHKLQQLFFDWDTLLPKRARYAIGALVYGAVGYSLYQFLSENEISGVYSRLEFRTGWYYSQSIAVLLVGANWYAEMLKWRRLVFGTVSLGRMHALRAVLYGTSLGLISPNRVGDFSGRSQFLPVEKRKEGASATIVSSLSQNIPTFICGAIACAAMYLQHLLPNGDTILLGGVFAGLAGTMLFALLIFRTSLIARWCRTLHFALGERYFNALSHRFTSPTLIYCLGLSFLRYSVFIVQFWLIASGLTAISLPQAFVAMAAAYLANAVIPTNQLVELGIRVAIPVLILSQYGADPAAIALASFVLWIINLAIPSLAGAFLYPRSNK